MVSGCSVYICIFTYPSIDVQVTFYEFSGREKNKGDRSGVSISVQA